MRVIDDSLARILDAVRRVPGVDIAFQDRVAQHLPRLRALFQHLYGERTDWVDRLGRVSQ